MKIIRLIYRGEPRYGILKGDQVEIVHGYPFDEIDVTGVSLALSKAELLSPVDPSKILAVGLNYKDHAEELDMDIPKEPHVFMKPISSLIGPGELIIYPEMSSQVDFEAELVIVVGKIAAGIKSEEAADYIFGYTCGNDVTARDIQRKDKQWTRAKGFDTFCPVGPHIETRLDTSNINIRSRLNKELRQNGNTSQMAFDVFHLISYISEVMTLYPGDIILTGTPCGVDSMSPGDTIEVEIEGIGTLRNKVEK